MTNLSGRSRENLQLSAAQEERVSPSSAAQSGSSYEAQGGLSQASPQAHDQQRELHRKPPRGLSQRIMLALTVLLTGLAALYSAAMVGVIGYTEEELISSFLEDDMDYVVSQIERGDTAIGLPHADVYGDAPGLKPVPAQFQDCPFGFTEITEAPAVFVWRRAWQGGSLMIVRDQEGFEEKEQELFLITSSGRASTAAAAAESAAAATATAAIFFVKFWMMDMEFPPEIHRHFMRSREVQGAGGPCLPRMF